MGRHRHEGRLAVNPELLQAYWDERYGPTVRPETQPDTPEVVRERQRVLADMPGDEEREEDQK